MKAIEWNAERRPRLGDAPFPFAILEEENKVFVKSY